MSPRVKELLAEFDRHPVLLAKHIERLETQHEGERAELTKQADKAPKDGAVVLTPEQAAAWTAYQALGKPDEVSAQIKDAAALRNEKGHRAAAKAVGYDEDVLAEFAHDKGLAIELRDADVDENGKKVTKALPHVVRGQGKEATAELLTAVVERDFPKYLPALTQRPSGAPSQGRPSGGDPYPGGQRRDTGAAPATMTEAERLEAKRRSGMYASF